MINAENHEEKEDLKVPKDLLVEGYCTDKYPNKFDYDDEDSKLIRIKPS